MYNARSRIPLNGYGEENNVEPFLNFENAWSEWDSPLDVDGGGNEHDLRTGFHHGLPPTSSHEGTDPVNEILQTLEDQSSGGFLPLDMEISSIRDQLGASCRGNLLSESTRRRMESTPPIFSEELLFPGEHQTSLEETSVVGTFPKPQEQPGEKVGRMRTVTPYGFCPRTIHRGTGCMGEVLENPECQSPVTFSQLSQSPSNEAEGQELRIHRGVFSHVIPSPYSQEGIDLMDEVIENLQNQNSTAFPFLSRVSSQRKTFHQILRPLGAGNEVANSIGYVPAQTLNFPKKESRIPVYRGYNIAHDDETLVFSNSHPQLSFNQITCSQTAARNGIGTQQKIAAPPSQPPHPSFPLKKTRPRFSDNYCWYCRNQNAECDQQRPECSRCKRRNEECLYGYVPSAGLRCMACRHDKAYCNGRPSCSRCTERNYECRFPVRKKRKKYEYKRDAFIPGPPC